MEFIVWIKIIPALFLENHNICTLIYKQQLKPMLLLWGDGPLIFCCITGIGALKKNSEGQTLLKNMELHRKTFNFFAPQKNATKSDCVS